MLYVGLGAAHVFGWYGLRRFP